MKRNITIMIGAVIGFLCLSTGLQGQSKKGEINVSITKEEDGKRKTFEKTYGSLEEMKKDKEYIAFAGEGESVWVNIDKEHDEEIKVIIKGDKEGSYTFSIGDDQDIEVMKLDDLAEDMSKIEVEIKKVMQDIDEESIASVQKIMKSVHWTDEESSTYDRSNISIYISDVLKGDFSKKAVTNTADELDDEELTIKVEGSRLIIKYPITETVETKVSLYDKVDEVLFVSRIAETSEDLSEQIDLSQHPSGEYWLELMVGKRRTTKKINIKKEE